MKQEQIHDALNLLDDDMIETVNSLRNEESILQNRKQQKILWMRCLSLAACLCVVIFGVYALREKDFFKNNNTMDGARPIETNPTSNAYEDNDYLDGESHLPDDSTTGAGVITGGTMDISGVIGEVPSVLIKIGTWKENGFTGEVAGIVDTEIFEVGAEIRVIFKSEICVGVPNGDGITYEKGAPTDEDFKVGSIVRVQFTIKADDMTAAESTTENGYVIYAELVAPSNVK